MNFAAFARLRSFTADELPRQIHQFEQNVLEKFRKDNTQARQWRPAQQARVRGTCPPSGGLVLGFFDYAGEPGIGEISASVQAHIAGSAAGNVYCNLVVTVDGGAPTSPVGATTAQYFFVGVPFVYDATLTFRAPLVIQDAKLHRYTLLAVTDPNTTAVFGIPQFQQDGDFTLWVNGD